MLFYVYGLVVDSEIPLGDFAALENGPADVLIRHGTIDLNKEVRAASAAFRHTTPTETVMYWPECGAISVSGGRTVVVDANEGVSPEEIRTFLTGPSLAVLLHQRGEYVLHASAVAVNRSAVAFSGNSMWGKSTISAALALRGYPLITDDVLTTTSTPEGILAIPGPARSRLRADAADLLGLGGELVGGKLIVDFSARMQRCPLPLRRVYMLTEGSSSAIEPLEGSAGFLATLRNSYCANLLKSDNGSARHFQHVMTLARSVRLYALAVRYELSAIEPLLDLLEDHLRSVDAA